MDYLFQRGELVDTDKLHIKKGIFAIRKTTVDYYKDYVYNYDNLLFRNLAGWESRFVIVKINSQLDIERSSTLVSTDSYWYECDVFVYDNSMFLDITYNRMKELLELCPNLSDATGLNDFWNKLILKRAKEVCPEEIYDNLEKLWFLALPQGKMGTSNKLILNTPKSYSKRHQWYQEIEAMSLYEFAYRFTKAKD